MFIADSILILMKHIHKRYMPPPPLLPWSVTSERVYACFHRRNPYKLLYHLYVVSTYTKTMVTEKPHYRISNQSQPISNSVCRRKLGHFTCEPFQRTLYDHGLLHVDTPFSCDHYALMCLHSLPACLKKGGLAS